MKCIVSDDVVLSWPLEGPLATHIVEFAGWLQDEGYALYSRRKRILLAACFSRWLETERVNSIRVSSELMVRYLRSRGRGVVVFQRECMALRQFIDFLRSRDVIPAERVLPRQPSPVEQAVQEYEFYLLNERALAQVTVDNYAPFVREFLTSRFGREPVKLSQLCAGDIVGFVQCVAPRLHLKRAKLLTTALRSFLHYARYRGDIQHDLAAAVPTVANWTMTSIPRAIPPDLVRRLLASIDRHTAVGLRDYAILLLLARLGLRACEIAELELEDIDWNGGSLCLQRKGGQRGTLPLPADVGTAIAAYLRHGRPRNCNSRRVFLRVRAPIRGFQNSVAISSLVQERLKRACIKAPTQGAHQFRHGLATDMLRHGASLTEIGEVLGHRSPETTKIYTKVDLDALRPLALPWPGGMR